MDENRDFPENHETIGYGVFVVCRDTEGGPITESGWSDYGFIQGTPVLYVDRLTAVDDADGWVEAEAEGAYAPILRTRIYHFTVSRDGCPARECAA